MRSTNWAITSILLLSASFLPGCGSHRLPSTSYLGEWRTAGRTFQRTGSFDARLTPPLKEVWRVKAGRGIQGSPVPIGPFVIVSTTDGRLKAYLIEDGKKVWEKKIKGGFHTSPVISDKKAFIASEYPDGSLYCIDIRGGDILWKRSVGPCRSTSSIEGGVLYTVTNSGELFAHTTADGNLLWKKPLKCLVPQSPVIAGDSLFVLCRGDSLKVLSTLDGTVLKSHSLAQSLYPASVLLGASFLYGSVQGIGILPSPRNAESIDLSEAPPTYHMALSHDLILGTDGVRTAFSIDIRSGKVLWTHATSGLLEASPIITGDSGLIVSLAGEIQLVDISTGTFLWEKKIEAPISVSPTVSEGRLLLATDRGELIAYNSKTEPSGSVERAEK